MAVDKNKAEQDKQSCLLRFCKIVLSWDYFRLLRESQRRRADNGGSTDLKQVKETYDDVDDYLSTFEPLLFEEAKANTTKDNNDEEEGGNWVIQQKVCKVTDHNEINGFHFPTVIYVADEKDHFAQNDLLLLSNDKFDVENNKLPSTYAFALVEQRQMPGSLRLRLFLDGEIKGTDLDAIQSCPRLINMRSKVSKTDKDSKDCLYMSKISSLSTIMREFVALWSVNSLPFRDVILKAADSAAESTDRAWKIPQQLMDHIISNHNESQLEAIRAGLSRRQFVLIQGPPGTGKTQTILGLLSAILHSAPARMHAREPLQNNTGRGLEFPMDEKQRHWRGASPWLNGINRRDEVMPVDGDDGFFPVTGSELKPEVVNSSRKYRVRVLVCAPSNSALDEIVLRVLNRGIHDENDRAYNPKIVRIGVKPHHSVQAVSMDYLVEQKLAGIGEYLTADKQKQGGGSAAAADRDSIRASVLDEAVIVFSTLSFSGSPVFTKLNRNFDIVIIDEAAQAVESATLIPLKTGCKQVFLVGDPVQLPATVISPTAQRLGYGMSLFKRFQKAGYPVMMLKTQYRMHPEIRSFPSKEFYDDALEDGAEVEERTKRSWHEYRCFGPFCFFDIHEGIEAPPPSGAGGYVNVDEVEFVLLLYQKLVGKYPELKASSMFAIITPYRQQVKLLRERFREMFGVESDKFVDINTVDGFQGREKDVAIYTCVRSNKGKGIGFVSDFRRMNVGITRARSSVLVVGSAATLKHDKHWNNLVECAEKVNSLFQVSKPYAKFFGSESLKSMEVQKETHEGEDMEIDGFVYGNPADADHGPADENDYGDDVDGGFDED